jgi:hypothetical protein
MTVETVSLENLYVIPNFREIKALEGVTELSEDVRLVTSNVLPLQRKAMRSILSGAGIRVVANKKKFIIEVSVVGPEKMDYTGIPEESRDSYYELEMCDNRVLIRTASQSGALYGTQTLSWIYLSTGGGTLISNFQIRDWSQVPQRGILVNSARVANYMDKDAWCELFDRMSAVKLNHLAVRVCGRSNPGPGFSGELLLVPVSDDKPEWVAEREMRWFSPLDNEWQEETINPKVVVNNTLGEVVSFAVERGIVLAPLVDVFARQTPFARLMPELAAVGNEGAEGVRPLCPSNPKTREFLAEFYGRMVDEYFQTGFPAVHIDVTTAADEPVCQCPACAEHSPQELVDAQVDWLRELFASKGVENVYVWNGDQADIQAGSGAVLGQCERELLSQAKGPVSAGTMATFAVVEDYEPDFCNRISTYAAPLWNSGGENGGIGGCQWSRTIVGAENAASFAEGVEFLNEACELFAQAAGLSVESCCAGPCCYGLQPAAILDQLAKGDKKAAIAGFQGVALKADAAVPIFEPMLAEDDPCRDIYLVRSLLADAKIISGISKYFQVMLEGGSVETAREGVLAAMEAVERDKPRWTTPTVLGELSVFLED